MRLPDRLQRIIDRRVDDFEAGRLDDLCPGHILLIYSLIGDTVAVNHDLDRIDTLRSEKLILTRSDRIRAQLAILIAKLVLHVWEETMIQEVEKWPIESRGNRDYGKLVSAWNINAHFVPFELISRHTIRLADELLAGQADVERTFSESCEIHYFGGSSTWMVEAALQAAKEALNTALGFRAFERLRTLGGGSAVLNGKPQWSSVAVHSARYAFAGIDDRMDESGYLVGLDANRSREFWIWWLSEAIPQAWEMEQDFVEPTGISIVPLYLISVGRTVGYT